MTWTRSLLALALLAPLAHAMFRDSSPLFKDSFHVHSLTDETFDKTVNRTNEVWLVDFYAPWCPHCRDFAPELEKIATFYAASATVHVGAVDCTKNSDVCNKENIMAYPTLRLFHVPKANGVMQKMSFAGRKNLKSVVMWAESALSTVDVSSGMSVTNLDEQLELVRSDPAVDGHGLPQERSAQMKYSHLQDAGSAAVFTLENSLFIGTNVLEGDRLHAALKWVESLAATFPLETNRKVFRDLAAAMKKRESWSQSAWTSLIIKWKAVAKESTYPKTLLVYDEEAAWAHCTTYTCGLWTLFHSMSVVAGSPSCPLKPSEVAAAIRLFVMHFFGCQECVKHFLVANPPSRIDELAQSDAAGNQALMLWLWKMHNKVNKVTRKGFWPSIQSCPVCYADNVRTPSFDPAVLREDELAKYITVIYEQREGDVWRLTYANSGLGSLVRESMDGYSLFLLIGLVMLLFVASSHRHKIGSAADALWKREHSAKAQGNMSQWFESEIATEGRGAASVTEDQWIAWDERLALAPGLAAKKALVSSPDSVMPDATYRAAWFPLLEAQELLIEATPEALERADQVLKDAQRELVSQLRKLRQSKMHKRADRLSHRHALLSLEVAIQRNAEASVIQERSQRLASLMNIQPNDHAPSHVDADVSHTEAVPTSLDYIDSIYQDMKDNASSFGSRKAHNLLPVPELQVLLEKDPARFKSDLAFALRYVQLLRADLTSQRQYTWKQYV
ncbi:hypothetical protein ATCC90586_010194 [Pythium insidiosum]|nr:hypothetical protein ATCC90586_010194 [Pythium insidiosum]